MKARWRATGEPAALNFSIMFRFYNIVSASPFICGNKDWKVPFPAIWEVFWARISLHSAPTKMVQSTERLSMGFRPVLINTCNTLSTGGIILHLVS